MVIEYLTAILAFITAVYALCEDFWLAIENLKYLLIETTFRNDNTAGAQSS